MPTPNLAPTQVRAFIPRVRSECPCGPIDCLRRPPLQPPHHHHHQHPLSIPVRPQIIWEVAMRAETWRVWRNRTRRRRKRRKRGKEEEGAEEQAADEALQRAYMAKTLQHLLGYQAPKAPRWHFKLCRFRMQRRSYRVVRNVRKTALWRMRCTPAQWAGLRPTAPQP